MWKIDEYFVDKEVECFTTMLKYNGVHSVKLLFVLLSETYG